MLSNIGPHRFFDDTPRMSVPASTPGSSTPGPAPMAALDRVEARRVGGGAPGSDQLLAAFMRLSVASACEDVAAHGQLRSATGVLRKERLELARQEQLEAADEAHKALAKAEHGRMLNGIFSKVVLAAVVVATIVSAGMALAAGALIAGAAAAFFSVAGPAIVAVSAVVGFAAKCASSYVTKAVKEASLASNSAQLDADAADAQVDAAQEQLEAEGEAVVAVLEARERAVELTQQLLEGHGAVASSQSSILTGA